MCSAVTSGFAVAQGPAPVKTEPKGIAEKQYYKDSKSRLNDDVNDNIAFQKHCGFDRIKVDLDYKLIQYAQDHNENGYLLCYQLPFAVMQMCRENEDTKPVLKKYVKSGLCLMNSDPEKITAELKDGVLVVSYGSNVTNSQLYERIQEYLSKYDFPEEKAKDAPKAK